VRWANDASVKLIASKLEVRPFVEKPAIMAAGKMRNETLVLPLCRLLEDFFAWKQASAALKEAGPVAERHVIRLLQHKDPKMRIEAATILAAIGTEKSVAPLRRAANDKNVKLAAQAAMENIKIRMEQDKKDK
jgi:HEAT repeat protein